MLFDTLACSKSNFSIVRDENVVVVPIYAYGGVKVPNFPWIIPVINQ
jgi:hypothetical protein